MNTSQRCNLPCSCKSIDYDLFDNLAILLAQNEAHHISTLAYTIGLGLGKYSITMDAILFLPNVDVLAS